MLKRALLVLPIIVALTATGVLAQRGIWEGCTLASAREKYTDQQMGGFLLHESATFLDQASKALARIHTPGDGQRLARIMSRVARDMEAISLKMGEKRLRQKDIQKFHQEIVRAREEVSRIVR